MVRRGKYQPHRCRPNGARITSRVAISSFARTSLSLWETIDDFGTGYSSLAYLKRFPIDTLKVDRSFIQDTPADTGDIKIAEAIIAMAHSLRLTVVAEGVETAEQLKFLPGQRCDEVQRYFLYRPLPEMEVTDDLKLNRRDCATRLALLDSS
jgi:EAL domain-containing protein (putative c-di-GMP-specific phosphodiesterase class I)